MIVAVSMRVVQTEDYVEPRDAVSHGLVGFLAGLGCIPVLIPNAADPEVYLRSLRFERLVLSGGEDIVSDVAGPAGAIADPRDRTERRLLEYAISRQIPVLGICRGAMLINLYLGGRLTQDLEGAVGEQHVARPHEVRLADGRIAMTNSFHNHGMLAAQLAPGLECIAATAGGVVEAFDSRDPRLLGLMWHPERPGSATDLDRELLGAWLG